MGLHWDGPVFYQSSCHEAYAEALDSLRKAGLVYPCDCSRRQIRTMGSIYDGRCRKRVEPPNKAYALRLHTTNEPIAFTDLIQGEFGQRLQSDVGDFVIKRKDSLFAYQLAVVVDDANQGITNIVRGYDLLDSTPRQIYLQKILQLPEPQYAHIPILVDTRGDKLSKQSHADSIDLKLGSQLMRESLRFLGQYPDPELHQAPAPEQLQWAVSNWDIQSVPKLATIAESLD